MGLEDPHYIPWLVASSKPDSVKKRLLTRWLPDTCSCDLVYDQNFQLDHYYKRCDRHRHLDGQALYKKVLEYNQFFNPRYHQRKDYTAPTTKSKHKDWSWLKPNRKAWSG